MPAPRRLCLPVPYPLGGKGGWNDSDHSSQQVSVELNNYASTIYPTSSWSEKESFSTLHSYNIPSIFHIALYSFISIKPFFTQIIFVKETKTLIAVPDL